MCAFPEITGFHWLLMLLLPIARVVRFIPLQVPVFEFPVAYNSASFSCLSSQCSILDVRLSLASISVFIYFIPAKREARIDPCLSDGRSSGDLSLEQHCPPSLPLCSEQGICIWEGRTDKINCPNIS